MLLKATIVWEIMMAIVILVASEEIIRNAILKRAEAKKHTAPTSSETDEFFKIIEECRNDFS